MGREEVGDGKRGGGGRWEERRWEMGREEEVGDGKRNVVDEGYNKNMRVHTAAQNGIFLFVRVVTQSTNVGLTASHFVWSNTHQDEVIQWSWLYYFMLFLMIVFLLCDVVFWFMEWKRAKYSKALYGGVQGDSVFVSFLFAFSQISELANYNLDNTFPKWQLALMIGLNVTQIVIRAPEVF
jgi:hypothetical protein